MLTYELTTSNNQNYVVKLPEPTPGHKSAYFFAFHKSGSSLMDGMLSTYCTLNGLAFFSLFGQVFSQGLSTVEIGEESLVCFKPTGYVYSGFRHYPRFPLPITDEPVALLVRDPRDMLVSLYYSVTKSHVIPPGNDSLQAERELAALQSIDSFVLKRAQGYLGQFKNYQESFGGRQITTFRYEDIVFNKKAWLRQMIDLAQLPVSRMKIRLVASQFDVIPESEQESEHIRQVHPGNHKKKLEPETIEKLNDILAPFLAAYDYR